VSTFIISKKNKLDTKQRRDFSIGLDKMPDRSEIPYESILNRTYHTSKVDHMNHL
jgi:hypothetical protein